MSDYVLTYWWNAALPGPRREFMGVAVHRAQSLGQAEADLGRELESEDPRVDPRWYEVLSAVVVGPGGVDVEAVGVDAEPGRRTVGVHASPFPEDGAWRHAGMPSAPNTYVVTGTEGGDDHRFAQVLHARDLDGAMLDVERYLESEGSGRDETKFWSAVEVLPDGTANVWWLGALTRARASFDLMQELAPASAPVVDVRGALDAINRHRRGAGLRPLDPAAAGWTDEDVLVEAERVARLANAARHLMAPR